MELKCPSLEYVEDMTWREFRLRTIGYQRQEKTKWYHTRILTHQIYLTIPEKGTKKSIDRFWPLEDQQEERTSQRQILIEAQRKVIEEAKSKKWQ